MNYTLKKVYRIRTRWCKTAALMYLIFFTFTVLTVLNSTFWPWFVFSLFDWVLMVLLTYYVEVLEVKESGS